LSSGEALRGEANPREMAKSTIYGRMVFLVVLALLGWKLYPWYSDRTSPKIELKIEQGQMFGDEFDPAADVFDEKSGLSKVSGILADLNGKPVKKLFEGRVKSKRYFSSAVTGMKAVPEGRYKFLIEAVDASLWKNKAVASAEIVFDHTPPELKIETKPAALKQGGTFAIYVASSEPVHPRNAVVDTGVFGDSSVKFYPYGSDPNRFRAILGSRIEAPVGSSSALLTFEDRAGNSTNHQIEFLVTEVHFGEGIVNLPAQKRRLLTDLAPREEDNRKLEAVRNAPESVVQWWVGKLILPAQGVVTSPFGRLRVYNRGAATSRHMGVDMANREGTPVLAANHGVVVFAEALNLRGNTVIIDHGQGVRSHYYHLKEIRANQGDQVKKGQEIGSMGSSGQSTGSHLHWGIQVHKVFVTPYEWTRMEF
ncbi:MAG: M23 family metallopeptidase, partial [Candidatus Latescibacterota bacterium]